MALPFLPIYTVRTVLRNILSEMYKHVLYICSRKRNINGILACQSTMGQRRSVYGSIAQPSWKFRLNKAHASPTGVPRHSRSPIGIREMSTVLVLVRAHVEIHCFAHRVNS